MKNKQKPTSSSASQDITVSGRRQSHADKILSAMKEKGGGTYEQIAAKASIKESQCWKRLSELERKGLIVDSGETYVLSSGKMGTIWEIKEGIKMKLAIPIDEINRRILQDKTGWVADIGEPKKRLVTLLDPWEIHSVIQNTDKINIREGLKSRQDGQENYQSDKVSDVSGKQIKLF